MDNLTLTTGQRRRLQHQLRSTQDARVFRRTFAVLEVSRGRSVSDIADTLAVSPRSVYYWIAAYVQTHDPAVLRDQQRTGRPSLWTAADRQLLQSLLERSPQEFGYFAVDWTVPLLQEHLEHCTDRWFSDETLRRELERQGYVWKRRRYVLDPDPEREKKTADSLANPPSAGSERGVGRG